MPKDWQSRIEIERLDANSWRIPRTGPMQTDGLVFADDRLMQSIRGDKSLEQVANVACLPGIVGPSIGMPDIHWGYGFPIGGVAAFDMEEGVISPGGVGYDINCGVRLLSTKLSITEVRDRIKKLVQGLFKNIPSGVGRGRKDLLLDDRMARAMTAGGARWAVEAGYGETSDLDTIEEGGVLHSADFDAVSERAFQRGRSQVGTIGSGNHFVEIGYVAEIYEPEIAERIGMIPNSVTIIIHTGSRGFGYQICEDSLRILQRASGKFNIPLPDRQLACAPIKSSEGREYLAAMSAGANFAFANRQVITHCVRETFEKRLALTPREHGIRVVYDVCHNIAKVEEHSIGGSKQRVCVHRKGATRAFPAGHAELPSAYRDVGQPVLVPGDMGRYSYVLVGHPEAPETTFASCCHGAGRRLSRRKALAETKNRSIAKELEARGIHIAAASKRTIDEEFPEAYKDVADVVDVVHNAKLAIKVAKLVPVGVIKG